MKSFHLFVISLFVSIFFAGITFADTTYTIKKGDNPAKIAKRYKISSKAILQANNIRATDLRPGNKIVIPSKNGKSDGRRDSKSARKSPEKIAKTVQHHDSSFHVVKKGDTLLSISRKHSVSVAELKEINDLHSSKLRLGQKILLKKTTPDEYTVQKGDTVWKIARKFNLDPQDLVQNNGLEGDSLQPGRRILLSRKQEFPESKTYDALLSQAPAEPEAENLPETASLAGMSLQDRLVLFAKKMLNIPYRFGGNTPVGIDCSAYVKKVYSLIGVNLPRSAREQFAEGKPVDGEELSMGDLVFFKTYASFPSHVGIYLGNNLFIHASSRSKKVTIDSLETPYYLKRFIGAKRLIDGNTEEENAGKES